MSTAIGFDVLSNQSLQRLAPAAFAQSAHESRSDRYGFVPTSEVIAGLQKAGFHPTHATQAKSRKEDRQFQAEESDKWQTFIGSLDDKWRAFNKEQREENNCAMADVNASLSNLTNVTGDLARSVEEMRVDIKAHDQQAKEILALVSKPTPKPRSTKSTTQQENK